MDFQIIVDGHRVLIDYEDFERIVIKPESYPYEKTRYWGWRIKKHGRNFYAVANIRIAKDKWTSIRMHRFILGLSKGDHISVDHVNGNGLDNRKSNLRICNQSQNLANSRPRNGTSKYKGVMFSKASKKWMAQICIKGKSVYLGLFEKEKDAALAYDRKAREVFGEFARLNH